MLLNYFALGLLVIVAVTLFYVAVAISEVPYQLAARRQHPQQDAIRAAGWVSLFTCHAIWPFLWIWATANQPPGEPPVKVRAPPTVLGVRTVRATAKAVGEEQL